jgi:hypothetical protein
MRVPTTPAFNKFLLDNNHYPFNRLKVTTRSSFFCKWIMLKGQSPIGLTYYFPVFANSHPTEVLLEMISSGQAKPFPLELSLVMDNMYWWGKSQSHQWYDQVVDSMGELLDCNDEAVDHREVVRYLISLEVKAKILEHFDWTSAAFEVTFDQWWTNFNCVYSPQHFDVTEPRNSFRQMAESSFEYLESLIEEVKDDIDFMQAPDRVNSA